MKLLLTGDVHLGRSYQKEAPEIAQRFADARLEALSNAVALANREECGFLVIAGDLYDKVSAIPKALHERVSKVLAEFGGQAVLVLPGNHDYYDAEHDQLWSAFEECSGSNVRLLKECAPYPCGQVVFYPCPCHNKRSKINALGWLKENTAREPGMLHIGIAHGAIDGYSPDAEQDYYHMTPQELLELGMDAWLIGHTHITFSVDDRIFSPGTPQQTDIADRSRSLVYLIEIDDAGHVAARTEKVGVVDFVRREVSVAHGQILEEALQLPELEPGRTALRVILTGIAAPEDYESRHKLYDKLREAFLKLEVKDEGLQKAITAELIDRETPEGSAINRLLHGYADNMELLNLAYALAQACKNEG